MTRPLGKIWALIAVLSCASAIEANMIADGSFENPVLGSGQAFGYLPGAQINAVWDVSGASYAVLIDNGYQSGGVTWYPSPAGQQYLYVSNAVNNTTVSQNVSLTGGVAYNLTWIQADFATVYVDPGGIVTISVDKFGGGNVTSLYSTVPNQSNWVPKSLQFVPATSDVYTISFISEFHHASLVDDVVLDVVPEPATILTLGACFAAFGACRRKRPCS